jgi:hypothetical protein
MLGHVSRVDREILGSPGERLVIFALPDGRPSWFASYAKNDGLGVIILSFNRRY